MSSTPAPPEWIAPVLAWQHRLKLTQVEAASRIGIDRATLARLLAGDRNPRLDTLQAMANATGITFTIHPDPKETP